MDSQNPNSLTAAPSKKSGELSSGLHPAGAPKFVRSKDRCHILARTPIYDKTGKLLAYTFRYTAGEGSFRPDMVEKKHVKHIAIGFYVRRHLDQFTQQDAVSMTQFPLCQEVTKYAKNLPASRFILHLQERQDPSASFQHQVNMLKRENMSIALDIYTIIYTSWFRSLRVISYAIVDMSKDIEEQFILTKTLLKKAPWIKIICDRCDNVNKASIAFEAGAHYVCCPTFPRDILKLNFNPYQYKVRKNAFDYMIDIIADLLEPRPDYQHFLDVMKERNDLFQMLPGLIAIVNGEDKPDNTLSLVDFNDSIYDIESSVLHKLICIVCLMILEEFYRKDKEVKYLRYEPLKQLLLRAQFVEELLTIKSGEIDISYAFAVGICSSISQMYAYLTPVVEQTMKHINAKLKKIYEEDKLFQVAVKIAESMESMSLEFVDGIMAADVFTRHDILIAYENSVMWLANAVDFVNTRRF